MQAPPHSVTRLHRREDGKEPAKLLMRPAGSKGPYQLVAIPQITLGGKSIAHRPARVSTLFEWFPRYITSVPVSALVRIQLDILIFALPDLSPLWQLHTRAEFLELNEEIAQHIRPQTANGEVQFDPFHCCWFASLQPFKLGPHGGTVDAAMYVALLCAAIRRLEPLVEGYLAQPEAYAYQGLCPNRKGGPNHKPSRPWCINGQRHGYIYKVEDHDGLKVCTNPFAVWQCEGHGDPPMRCAFNHADGSTQPCRYENPNDRGKCTHEHLCFGEDPRERRRSRHRQKTQSKAEGGSAVDI